MSRRTTARWSGHKVKFQIESESGHSAVIDEPPEFGDDEGMTPTEMLLGALGGCTGVNAVLLLKKHRQPFKSLAVEVVGEQQAEWPKAFTRIEINFSIGWDGEYDEAKVHLALDQACNRYCPVDATLTNGAKITHRHTVAADSTA